ncbi:MAG: hypothetical protein LIQ31_14370 [Planctomycetes bacterium]|nr:hypothetical protein [Planctomycetota bacterium]
MDRLEEEGFCKVDRKNHLVFDSWGMGIVQFIDGYNPIFAPMRDGDRSMGQGFMPPRLPADFLTMDDEDAVQAYTAPDIDMPGAYTPIRDAVQKSAAVDRLVVAAGYSGVFERAYGLRSFEAFMMDLAAEPERAMRLMNVIADFKVEDAKRKVAMGVQIGHHGDDLATQIASFFSPDMFKDMFLPNIKRIFAVFKDADLPVAMHSCGNITAFIPDLIDAGLDLLEPVQPCMDLEYLKREFGRDLSFWGGIDTQELLPFAPPDKVREETRRVMRILGKNGGYIAGPSQEVMNDVPVANIIAMVETIREEQYNM